MSRCFGATVTCTPFVVRPDPIRLRRPRDRGPLGDKFREPFFMAQACKCRSHPKRMAALPSGARKPGSQSARSKRSIRPTTTKGETTFSLASGFSFPEISGKVLRPASVAVALALGIAFDEAATPGEGLGRTRSIRAGHCQAAGSLSSFETLIPGLRIDADHRSRPA